MSFCTQCGTRLSDDAAFCTACGAPLKPSARPAANAYSAPAMPSYSSPYVNAPSTSSPNSYPYANAPATSSSNGHPYANAAPTSPYASPYANSSQASPYANSNQAGPYAYPYANSVPQNMNQAQQRSSAPQTSGYTGKPAVQLRTNRGLLKFILLTIITFGIYGLVCMSHISEEINTVAERHDGQHTMHYCLIFFLFSWLTLGIVPLVWQTRLSNRMGRELSYRGINYKFSGGTFWGWGILGSLIIVGPFIYGHKLFRAMNLINADFNRRG